MTVRPKDLPDGLASLDDDDRLPIDRTGQPTRSIRYADLAADIASQVPAPPDPPAAIGVQLVEGSTYTLQPEDHGWILVFLQGCTVTVPGTLVTGPESTGYVVWLQQQSGDPVTLDPAIAAFGSDGSAVPLRTAGPGAEIRLSIAWVPEPVLEPAQAVGFIGGELLKNEPIAAQLAALTARVEELEEDQGMPTKTEETLWIDDEEIGGGVASSVIDVSDWRTLGLRLQYTAEENDATISISIFGSAEETQPGGPGHPAYRAFGPVLAADTDDVSDVQVLRPNRFIMLDRAGDGLHSRHAAIDVSLWRWVWIEVLEHFDTGTESGSVTVHYHLAR